MSLEQATIVLRAARAVAVLTGAGISADSGLPTFRGARGGLWERFRPESLATPEAFARDPALVWAWYQWRRALAARAQPNPAHFALVTLERAIPAFTLVTQNVDGLHRRAGSERVIALHGELMRDRCSGCGRESAATVAPELADAPRERIDPPRCADCGAPLRPAVVWFGEALPDGAMERAAEAAALAEVLLVVGTSQVVYPAASLVPLARRAGARVIVVNPEQSPGDVDLQLTGRAADLLPPLVHGAFGA